MLSAQEIIDLLQLEPLTFEGGFYRQTYCADEQIPQQALPQRYTHDKAFGTCIYYLLTPETYSEFHALPTDEIYHFYLGDPVEMIELHEDGECTATILGPDIAAGQKVQHLVPKGTWQASYVLAGGSVALLGCTMAPGFDRDDFQKGNWETLLRKFPKHHQIIMRLTRK